MICSNIHFYSEYSQPHVLQNKMFGEKKTTLRNNYSLHGSSLKDEFTYKTAVKRLEMPIYPSGAYNCIIVMQGQIDEVLVYYLEKRYFVRLFMQIKLDHKTILPNQPTTNLQHQINILHFSSEKHFDHNQWLLMQKSLLYHWERHAAI